MKPIAFHVKYLGWFRRTGEVRTPRVGEYYLCSIINGVALAVQNGTQAKEIVKAAGGLDIVSRVKL